MTPRGYLLTLTREGDGYLIRTPQGVEEEFDGEGLLRTVTDPTGNTVSYQYNGDKSVSAISDALGNTVTFGYSSGKLTSIVDAAQRNYSIQDTVDAYNAIDNALVITSPSPGQDAPLVTTVETGTGAYLTLPSHEVIAYSANSWQLSISWPQYYVVPANAQYLANNPSYQSFVISPASDRIAHLTTGPSGFDYPATKTVDQRGWVIESTDFEGHVTKYDRDDNGLIKSITLPGDTEPQYTFTYDDRGNMLTRTSKATSQVPQSLETWEYDTQWNVPNLYVDADDNTTTYDIDPANGQVRSIHQQSFDESGGEPTTDLLTYFYYTEGGGGIAAGLLTRQVGPGIADGQYVETRYDYAIEDDTLVQTVTDAFGTSRAIQRKYVYDKVTMNLLQFVDEREDITDYSYDNVDRLKKITEPSPGPGLPRPTWNYDYRISGYEPYALNSAYLDITDPNGAVTTYEDTYTGYLFRQDVSITANGVTQYPGGTFYDSMGRLTSEYVTLDTGVYAHYDYKYDANSNLIEEKLPALADGSRPTTTYHYNDQNLLEWSRDPAQHTTYYQYDNRGELTNVSGAGQPSIAYSYDQRGFQIGVQDSASGTSYQYDMLGRVTRVAEPNPGTGLEAAVTTYQYDDAGNTRFVTTGAESVWAQTTEYVYDELNRLRAVKQPTPQSGQQPITLYTYYDTGELHTLTDPNGNVTTYGVANLGRTTSEKIVVDNTILTRSYHYDAIGNLDLLTDRDGRVTKYTYDALNRMTDETWFQSASDLQANNSTRTLSYRYDLAGDLKSAYDPSASYTFTPDSLGEVLSTSISLPGLTGPVSLVNHYDADGNRDSLTASINGVQDFVNAYTYDNANRLTSVMQTGATVASKQVGFQYNAAGQLTKLNRFDHTVQNPTDPTDALASTTYGYDGAGRLNAIKHTAIAASTIQMSWVYDSQNRVQQFHNTSDAPTAAFYGYDANNQLIATTGGSPEHYSYDAGGNRIGTGIVTDSANRLVSDAHDTYLYDAEGNLTSRTETATGLVLNLEWDNRNRLTAVREWKIGESHILYELDYEYDVFDRRVARKETTYQFVDGGEGGSQVVSTTIDAEKYIYDGDHIVYDFASTDAINYTLSKRYLYGPAVDQLLAQENVGDEIITAPDRVYWMLADNEGTIRDIVDNDGALVEHYKYSAFGTLLDGDQTLTRYLYTGRELDATTGLQYNRARWYDSGTGRWLSEDPSGFSAGDTNLYRYAGNNPTSATDPSGLAPTGPAAKTLVRGLERLSVRSVFQVHHIIGKSIFAEAKYAAWFGELGIGADSAKNLIALPNNIVTRLLSGRTLHNGRHLADYVDAVKSKVDDIMGQHTSGLINEGLQRNLWVSSVRFWY